MSYLEWIWTHREEIAAFVTYVMTSVVIGAHSLVGFAKGLRALSRLTSSKVDDEAADRFLALAKGLEAGARKASEAHARIMPRPLNPTPASERAGVEP